MRTFPQRKLLAILRVSEFAHDRLGLIEEGGPQINRHGDVGAQEIDVGLLGRAAGQPLQG